MSKKILINDSHNIYIKNLIKYTMQSIASDYEVIVNQWNGQLFYSYQKLNPDMIIWSTSRYDQEFHEFLSEYQNCKVLLYEDAIISQEDLVPILNAYENLFFVSNREIWKRRLATVDKLYDDQIFFNKNLHRNNKYLVMLSSDNDKNKSILQPILYPNNIDKKIVAIGNPGFDNPTNIGISGYEFLPELFNEFSYLIDIESNYHLEAYNCGMNILDNENLQQSIDDNIFIEISQEILSESTYSNFVNKHIANFIKEKL